MFCPDCGTQNDPNAVYCGSCGFQISKPTPVTAGAINRSSSVYIPAPAVRSGNGFGAVALIFGIMSIFLPVISFMVGEAMFFVMGLIGAVVGIIFGGVGIHQAKKHYKSNGTAIAGLVISIVVLSLVVVFFVFSYLISMIFVGRMINEMDNYLGF